MISAFFRQLFLSLVSKLERWPFEVSPAQAAARLCLTEGTLYELDHWYRMLRHRTAVDGTRYLHRDDVEAAAADPRFLARFVRRIAEDEHRAELRKLKEELESVQQLALQAMSLGLRIIREKQPLTDDVRDALLRVFFDLKRVTVDGQEELERISPPKRAAVVAQATSDAEPVDAARAERLTIPSSETTH